MSSETLSQDLRYGIRMLVKAPGFAIAAVLTLALGIGASTTIFSVTNAALLRSLPFRNPQQVVRIWEQTPKGRRINLAKANFDDFCAQNETFASLAIYQYWVSSVSGGSEPARVQVASVSTSFFQTFGVAPFQGRLFASDEQRRGGTPAVIVSYEFWKQYLAGVNDFSRSYLQIDGTPYQVIGVMPAGFDFPRDSAAWISSELLPVAASRRAHNWRGIGRLRDGITLAQARANLRTIAQRIRLQYGNDIDFDDAAVIPLADADVGNIRAALLTLSGAVGLLLLVASANVIGLMLSRTSSRRKELAIRATLGARRSRVIQQFLAESVALSFPGGALGVLIAALGIKLLPAILPASLHVHGAIALDAPVLLFALAATMTVTLLLGLCSAWRSGSEDLQLALTACIRGYSGSGSSQRLRRILVIGEIATTFVILVGAGLLSRSFWRLIATSPGFREQNLIIVEFSMPIPKGILDEAAIARQVQLLDDLERRLQTIPGVKSAGWAGAIPVAAGDTLADGDFVLLNGQHPPADLDELSGMAKNRSQIGHALYAVVDQGCMGTLGIPLIRGRMFGDQDGQNSPHVAVISQTLAQERWPNQDPIGETIEFANMDGNLKPLTIVGIVGDIRARGLDSPPSSIVYVNSRQRGMNSNSSPVLLIRGAASLPQIMGASRRIFVDVAPQVPLKFFTFADKMGGWLADRRFLLVLIGAFALAALVLAAIGIYGVVAFSVGRRTQEIGIRMSIGATRSDILRLVMGEGARMAGLGLLIGVGGSLAINRLMSALVFEINVADPLTFIVIAVLLAFVALTATYLPARRAMRVQPMTALRYE